MGTLKLLLCLLGHYSAAQIVTKKQGATFFSDVPGFFKGIIPFPFEKDYDFSNLDTIFSSWRSWTPDIQGLTDFPAIPVVPSVEVFCDESKLTVLVDKRSNGLALTREKMQLGDGCYSNRELPNQFVFTYSLDECGTTPVMLNGLLMFTNSLHLNVNLPPANWWQTRPTVQISCVPKRPYPNFLAPTASLEHSKTFNIKAMNPSWTGPADSNVYERGQVVNLQVSAKTRPKREQLFIQSCFVSASPEPQTRPRHAVVMNKGCTARWGSRNAVVHFVASDRADVVDFVLDTYFLISELYIHCSVLISDQGVNFGSKSCNYNIIQLRWEDLSGNLEVCECCTSRCKGLSLGHLPKGAKAIVSAGPIVIVDEHMPRPPGPQEASSAPVADALQSESAGAEDALVSGNSALKHPEGVAVVSQEQDATAALWLPGQVRDAEHSEEISSGSEDNLTKSQASDTTLHELQPIAADQEPLLKTTTGMVKDETELGSDDHKWDLNSLTLVDGWVIPPPTETAAFAEESQRKKRFGRSGISETEVQQDVDVPLTADMNANVLHQNCCKTMVEELAVTPQEEAQPIVRSKLQFSKGTDGSRTLSYEEEVQRRQESKGVIRRFRLDGIKRTSEPGRRGLHSTFLDLLRMMDKAE